MDFEVVMSCGETKPFFCIESAREYAQEVVGKHKRLWAYVLSFNKVVYKAGPVPDHIILGGYHE